MKFIYQYIFIPLGVLALPLLKMLLPKLKERESVIKSFPDTLSDLPSGKRVWFHASSMGEFEQIRPLVEKLKSENRDVVVICSVFSPSAYNNLRNYKIPDLITFMPLDTKSKAKAFVQLIKPDVFILDRYDLWYNHLVEIKNSGAKMFLINATRPQLTSFMSALLRKFYFEIFSFFDFIYTAGKKDFEYFDSLGLKNEVVSSADTRFDRIAEVVHNSSDIDLLAENAISRFVFIAGSIWEDDERIILPVFKELLEKNPELLIVLVPHEPSLDHCRNLLNQFDNSILLSNVKVKTDLQENVIIVDSVGKLISLYHYANAVYIGGGFGVGIHSVTEPAGFGKNISCGKNYTNSPDAVRMKEKNAITIVQNHDDFKDWAYSSLDKDKFLIRRASNAENYIFENVGQTEVIGKKIIDQLIIG